jgi:hypothetical protein
LRDVRDRGVVAATMTSQATTMTSQAATMTSQVLITACNEKQARLPMASWLPVRPSGLRRIPLAAPLVHYTKRSFTHSPVDKSRVRSIIAIKHETHVSPVLIRNFLHIFIFMHLLDVQASVRRERF